MADDNETGTGNENPIPEEGDKGTDTTKDTNKPPLQAIAISTGVIAVAAAAAAAKYLTS